MDYAALNTELTTDPLTLGYATPLGNQDWPTCAALLNATTGAGAATVSLPTMSNADFVLAFAPYLANVGNLVAPKQAYYISLLWPAILQIPTMDFTNANVQALMAQAVADGLLTTAQATALNQRTGSRAEALFGVGTVISWHDVSDAILKN